MIEELWEEYGGYVLGLAFAAFACFVAYAVVMSGRQKNAACARAWSIAGNSADSIAVIKMCEIGDEQHTTYVPVVIPVR